MKTDFRLKTFPLYRLNAEMRPEMPGLLLRLPPARCARSRRDDAFLVYLAVSGARQVDEEEVRRMVARAADTFYQTSGSVTTALRAAAAALNADLRRLNAAASEPGQYLAGRVVLLAIREDALYFLLSGAVQVFSLSVEGGQTFSADARAGRGLGLGQAVPHTLGRLERSAPMKLALCAQAPAEWEAFFTREKAATPAAVMADSLLQLNDQDVHAVLLDVQPAEEASEPHNEKTHDPLPSAEPQAQPPAVASRLSPEQRRALAEQALTKIQRGRARWQRWRKAWRQFATRLLPFADEGESADFLSNRLLAFLAVLIPLVVAIGASTVYLQRGLRAQAQGLYAQADALAVQARTETNPVLQRESWQAVLSILEQADALMPLEESAALQKEARAALDQLDGVLRTAFVPAALNLPPEARITGLAASARALYLLDATTNAVYRAERTASGYRWNAGFSCAAEGEVGRLVAVLASPERDGALAVGAGGGVLWCEPGAAPRISRLPATNRGELQIDVAAWRDGFLYLLDRNARAVWIYPPDEAGEFTRPPLYFFDAEVPDVANVQAMDVYGGELFLLNGDGSLTICQYSLLQTVPNRCEEGVILRDTRPGYTDAARIPGTAFAQLQVTLPPNTALLARDSAHSAVYRFSPQTRLLQNVLKAQTGQPPDGLRWTAFVVTPDAVLVVAADDQVYFAPHIP